MYTDYTKFYKPNKDKKVSISYMEHYKTEDKKKTDYTKFFKSF